MNNIPAAQNSDDGQVLLRARQAVYASAATIQRWQLVITVLAPVVGAAVGLANPGARPWVAALSLIIAILDAALLDRLQRERLKTAAKIAEQFDTQVLRMPWNTFVAGKKVDYETIHEAASRWSRPAQMAKVRDWYPTAAGRAPLHLARIICQRTNLWYDSTLRRQYGSWVLIAALAVSVGLVISGLALRMTMLDFVATVLAPASPILIWSIREYYRQRDTAEAQETVKAEAEALWDRAKAGGCGEIECLERSREFQNSIYMRRVSSPLMFPFVYQLHRNSMEARMNVGADAMLREIGLGRETGI